MSTRFARRMSVALLACGLLATVARADEPKDLDKIPKAVLDAIRAKFPRAKIEKWSKEIEHGKEVYDLEFKQDGKKIEADVFADGTIENWEQEFPAKDLPKAVTEAVEKKYAKSTINSTVPIPIDAD